MIEHGYFVGDWNAGPFQVADGPDNFVIFHVPTGVIVRADGENARMLAMAGAHNEVEILEGVMIHREKKQGIRDGVNEVASIRCARRADVRRNDYLVTCSAQHRGKRRLA